MIPPTNKKLMWNVLETKYVSHEPWHTVREEKVQLPNGNIVPNYYVLEYPDWVSVIALTKEKKMVLIQQYRHAQGGVFYEIPAGTSEPTDASMLDAAKRELKEETGYGGGTWREYMVISANPQTHNNVSHIFLAEDVELLGGQHLDNGEAITVHLTELNDVFEMLKQNAFLQSLMAAPLWKFFYEKDIR